MKKIPKKTLDSLLTMTRKYWETGEHDYITCCIALCESLQKATSVDWIAFHNLTGSILQGFGFKPRATNATIYDVLKVLGYEVVDDGKEQTSESL